MMTSLPALFKELDTDFVDVEKTEDTTYVYNATDVLVQTTWELPIVIQYPESTVRFEFCSNPGDISFGIVFVAAPDEGQGTDDLEIETVEEMGLVRSNLEAISGSFEVPCEGVVFFMWDNNFDWSAHKQISYLIEVSQPVFRFNDRLRVEKSLPLLAETVEDLNASYVRSADAHDCIDHNTANVSFLEDQLASLQRKRQTRLKEKTALDAEITALEKTVELGILTTPGLCIRSLQKSIMGHVLSYLNPSGGVNKVCKYWAEIAAEQRQNGGTAPVKLPTHQLKRTKSEIKTSLAQIQSGKMLRELSRQQAAQAAAALTSTEVPGSGPNSPARDQSSGKAGSTGNGTATPALSATSVSGSNAALGGAATTTTAAASTAGDSTAAAVHGSAGPAKGSKKAAGRSLLPSRSAVRPPDGEVSDTSDSDGSASPEAGAENTGRAAPAGIPLQRTDSGRSGSNNNKVRVSFDNVLPASHTLAHSSSFTTKVTNALSPPISAGKKPSSASAGNTGRQTAIAQKHHPQPAAENATAKDVANFASSLAWGRERPATTDRAVAPASPQKARRDGAATAAPVGPAEMPQLPMVAESKHRKSRAKSAPRPAISAATPATGDSAKEAGRKSARESENHRHLLQHVKKVRSEQQLQAMVEYLQAGFIKIENLSLEKRRIKKLIKAWNTSFEKTNSRVPTSGERKGHLRELYEEYHQVSLALRIRVEKMEDSLRTVGLTQDEFVQLRDKKLSDW